MLPEPADLRTIDLFKGLPGEVTRGLLRAARLRHVQEGGLIFAENLPVQAVHVLLSGFGKLTQTTAEGARVILHYVGPGETLGTPALTGGRYPADAVAVAPCVELQWPIGEIRAMLLRHPQIALNGLTICDERLRGVESRIGELSNAPVERRIAQALIRLLRKHGRRTGEGIECPFPFTRQDMADMTGTTLHTVSRTLGVWERQGLIERGRLRVRVTDLKALAAIAEGATSLGAAPRRTHRRSAAPPGPVRPRLPEERLDADGAAGPPLLT